jgi:hypothetical protein
MPGVTNGSRHSADECFNASSPSCNAPVGSHCDRRSPATTNPSDGDGQNDNVSERQLFKLEMHLSIEEGKNIRLGFDNAVLQSENAGLEEQLIALKKENNAKDGNLATLENTLMELTNELKRTNHQQQAEPTHTRNKNSALQAELLELTDELEPLKMDYQRVKSRNDSHLGEKVILAQENDDLHSKIRLLQACADRNDDVSSQLSARLARLDINDKAKDEDKATIERKSAEIKDLLEKNGHLEEECRNKSRENTRLNQEMRHSYVEAELYKEAQDDILKLSVDLKSANATKVTLQYQINTMRDENIELRKTNKSQHNEIVALKKQPAAPKVDPVIEQLKLDMAYYITQLDLANAGIRVYTCDHSSMSNIREDQTGTRVKPMWLIANQMFNDWKAEPEFMRMYKLGRVQVLKHHKAHEQQNAGRGDGSWVIRDHCKFRTLLAESYADNCRPEY